LIFSLTMLTAVKLRQTGVIIIGKSNMSVSARVNHFPPGVSITLIRNGPTSGHPLVEYHQGGPPVAAKHLLPTLPTPSHQIGILPALLLVRLLVSQPGFLRLPPVQRPMTPLLCPLHIQRYTLSSPP